MHWLEDFYAAYDDHDLERMLSMVADDISVGVVGIPPAVGIVDVRAWFGAVFELAVAKVHHELDNVWYVDSDTAIVEFTATGNRPNGDDFVLPGMAKMQRRGDKIAALLTYCDPNPPGLAAELSPSGQ